MPVSHRTTPQPSASLALLCLAVVHRLRPQWLAIPVAQAAASEQVSAQRVSRLCSRTLPQFESVVAESARIGRPPGGPAQRAVTEQAAIAIALLDVTTSMLAKIAPRGPQVRTLVLGSWLRLKQQFPSLTQRRFCHALAVSERTLRSWKSTAPVRSDVHTAPEPAEGKAPYANGLENKAEPRGPRRPRFGFDVVLPQTQFGAEAPT